MFNHLSSMVPSSVIPTDPDSTAPIPSTVPMLSLGVQRPDTVEEIDSNLHKNYVDTSVLTSTPIFEYITAKQNVDLSESHQVIIASRDTLFFISYHGANTLRPRW